MRCINKQSLMSVMGESRDAESDSCLSSVWGKKQKYSDEEGQMLIFFYQSNYTEVV